MSEDIDNAEALERRALRNLWLLNLSERFIKRVEQAIFALRNIQSAESLSAISALCVCVPLAINPNFFDNAPYFKPLAHYVSEEFCTYYFLALSLLQIAGLILGAEPPAFPEDGRLKILWLKYRIALLVIAASSWGAMGYLCNSTTPTMWGCWNWFLVGTSTISIIYLMLVQLKPTMMLQERRLREAAHRVPLDIAKG